MSINRHCHQQSYELGCLGVFAVDLPLGLGLRVEQKLDSDNSILGRGVARSRSHQLLDNVKNALVLVLDDCDAHHAQHGREAISQNF